MEQTKGLLTPHDYKMAIASQDACNLSGIVFSFAQVMQRICNEASEKGHGTTWRNEHPISRLYAEQIAHLSGAGQPSNDSSYHLARKFCEARALDIPLNEEVA